MTDQPIRKTMNKIEVAGRFVQQAIELGHFDIEYRPQVAIKAQVLVDFVAEFTYPQEEEELQNKTQTIQTDGSATKKAGRAGVVFISPEEEILKYVVRLQFPATNYEAKYKALLIELCRARVLEAKTLIVQADSQLVIGQVRGDYAAKEERMQKYPKIIQELLQYFNSINFQQIP